MNGTDSKESTETKEVQGRRSFFKFGLADAPGYMQLDHVLQRVEYRS